jgi:hypothetical protein
MTSTSNADMQQAARSQEVPPIEIVNIPEPPSVDEGWLPEILRDKSYVYAFDIFSSGPVLVTVCSRLSYDQSTDECFQTRTTELQAVLSNATLITALATLHPSYSASQGQLQQLLEKNKALAQHVSEVETQLANLRTATESLLLNHQSLEVSWRKKQSEMDAALAPWSPKALYQRLVAAVAEQEAICQAVVESFLEGDHDGGKASDREVTEWVRRIRTEGAKLELRREGRARWDEGRVGGWR